VILENGSFASGELPGLHSAKDAPPITLLEYRGAGSLNMVEFILVGQTLIRIALPNVGQVSDFT
jgi:hypothetical protein